MPNARALRVAVATLALACLAGQPGAVAQQDQGPAPPTLRLGDDVRPTRYDLELELDPDVESFAGEVTIDVVLRNASSVIWLNAAELEIERAAVASESLQLAAEVAGGGEDFIGLLLPEAIGPGKAQLRLRYRGKMPDDEVGGLFRRRVGDDWYLFSQLEPSDARRVFPGFDEPRFKVPFRVTITAAAGDLAFFNTPAAAVSERPDGRITYRYGETRPLPSYLLAFAVGPFEVVEAGRHGAGETPIRIITPKGKSAEAQYAAEATGPILELLEDYFGMPYPYEKLDQIAVANFFGAMENPGLVTYGQSLILRPPAEDTISRQRGFAEVCAHELAHMWFGDYVTMAWWDDIWLNEAFATWMESKIVDAWKPGWDMDVAETRSRGSAMRADSLRTARRIRQPIESVHDIASAFDSITYSKGAAVLGMFESWIGEEKFRAGVRRYLAEHAHANATGDDFLTALSETANPEIAAAFSTFLDQNGVPLVAAELRCEEGAKPVLALSQRRYLPAGSDEAGKQQWRIPVCVEYDGAAGVARQCSLMTGPDLDMALDGSDGCPRWVLPNADMAGYYRVDHGALLPALFEHWEALSLAERVGVVDDMAAMVAAGRLSPAAALSRVPRLVEDGNRHVISSSVRIVAGIDDDVVPEDLRSKYARFVRRTYGEQAHALGWSADEGEDDDTRLLRPVLVGLVADEGEDPQLIAEAVELAGKWLEDRSAIDPDMVGTVLGVAAKNGDAALWQKLYDAAKKATEIRERRRLVGTMGGFTDPELVRRNLAILGSDEFQIFELAGLLFGVFGEPATRQMGYDFVKQNFDLMLAKIPPGFQSFLPSMAGAFCDEEHARDAESFFRPRIETIEGGPRALDQTLEAIRLCAANQALVRPSVAAFLQSY